MTETATRRPTSADVAREAGLSRSTVSYVLNGNTTQKIPDATRQRVFDAAAKLGYAPSAAARMLRSGRSDVVLCLLPDWPMSESLAGLLDQLSAQIEEHDLTLLLHTRSHSSRPLSVLWRSINPAAVLLFRDVAPEEKAAMRSAGVALTLALMTPGKSKKGEMHYAEHGVGELQVEHLISRGHLRLGYAASPDPRVHDFAERRLSGVRDACLGAGLAPPDVRKIPTDRQTAAAVLRRWRSDGVTGICAYNDDVALAVLAGAHTAGIAVPGELAVIGVDDISAAPLAIPALTSIRRDLPVTAREITRAVVAGLGMKAPPAPRNQRRLQVVPRGST